MVVDVAEQFRHGASFDPVRQPPDLMVMAELIPQYLIALAALVGNVAALVKLFHRKQ